MKLLLPFLTTAVCLGLSLPPCVVGQASSPKAPPQAYIRYLCASEGNVPPKVFGETQRPSMRILCFLEIRSRKSFSLQLFKSALVSIVLHYLELLWLYFFLYRQLAPYPFYPRLIH